MTQIAYVDIGNTPKESYQIIQGQLPKEKEKIDCYWYEEDIAVEEFAGEVNDLLSFYGTVILGLPIPERLNKEVDKWK